MSWAAEGGRSRRLVPFALLACAVALTATAGSAGAAGASRSCGKVAGTPLHAHVISCATARRVYRLDLAGRLPSGWTCSAALGRCARGKLGSSEYLWWPPGGPAGNSLPRRRGRAVLL